MKKMNVNRKSMRLLAIWVGIFAILAFYNNCSGYHSTGGDTSSSSISGLGGSCDDILIEQYRKDIYPFFRQASTCMGCHIEGGIGLGQFASADYKAAFTSFNAIGMATVGYMATNPAHKAPYTGEQNRPAITAMASKWSTYQSQYLSCQSKTQNGGVNVAVLTSGKTAPRIYSSARETQTLTWDLSQAADLDGDVTRSLPARLSIDVRVLYKTTNNVETAVGYIFSNPIMTLLDGTKQVLIEGLFFQINGLPIASQTTYTGLSRIVTGSQPVPLMPRIQANTLIQPLSSNDSFQLYLPRIMLTSANEESVEPLTPILRVADPDTANEELVKSRTLDLTILRDSGITRWCLTESATRPASTAAACPGGATGPETMNGWTLYRPTSYTVSAGDGPKTLYLWVANQALKINSAPATATFVLDTTRPVAPTIASINVLDTQVANMSASHPNSADVAKWCVYERGSVFGNTPPTPSLNDDCWEWTDNGARPTTVGFKDGGSRNVWVFVQDRAGNVSAASNLVTAFNPYGAISYYKLTGPAGNPQSVFTNRCASCHSSASGPGYSTLKLIDPNDAEDAIAVAENGVLVFRINNPLSPMPNVGGGLMPQRERDLIRLWTMPEGGGTPIRD